MTVNDHGNLTPWKATQHQIAKVHDACDKVAMATSALLKKPNQQLTIVRQVDYILWNFPTRNQNENNKAWYGRPHQDGPSL